MYEKILLVDDCAAVREVLREALVRGGYVVMEAADGRSALRQIAADIPALVLLDIGLPDLSGWDLLWLIRLSDRWRDIPVVVLTGLNDDASITYGWQLGCTCYLAKPIDLVDLQLVISKVLSSEHPSPAAALNDIPCATAP